ncbi:DUF2905 domain-containing protein [Patescibacteria group bacterium]|nr:DUF2905 domain-containing protein [Patescibacteria group bacterium]
MGNIFIVFVVVFVLVSVFLMIFSKGRHMPIFPWDIYIKRGNYTLHFPLGSSLIISVILTILLNQLKK